MQFDPISRGTRFFGAASFLFGSSETEQILDAIPFRAALVDAAGRVGVVNAAWRMMADGRDFFSVAMHRGLNYLELCDSQPGVNARAAWIIANGLRAVLSGDTQTFETRYTWHFSGEPQGFKCIISAMGQDGGTPLRGAMVLHVEMTALGEDHPAGTVPTSVDTADSQRNLGMVTDRIPALVSYVDANITFRAANRHFESWFGVQAADIIGMSMVEVIGPVLFRRIQSHVYTALSGSKVSFEDLFEEHSGGPRWFRATFIPDVTAEGRVRGFSALAYNITRYKELESTLAETKLSSERCTRLQSDLLGHVATEMNAPLTSIVGFSETLASELFGPLADQYREYSKDIRDTACSLVDMAGDLVDLAKVQSGQLTLDEERIDLRAMLVSGMNRAQQAAKTAGIKLDIRVPRTIPGLFADERMVRQVTLNLVASMVRLAADGATLLLTIQSGNDGSLTIYLTDNESTTPQDDLDRLAEPFARLEAPRSSSAMMGGLALPLARHFMELHGGSLSFQRGPKRGVTIAAVFPRARVVG